MLNLPPPLWAILTLTVLYFASELPVFAGLPSWGHRPAGSIVIVLGLMMPVIAMSQFLAAGTQILPTSEKNDRLVTGGLYVFTRNPMYLGLVVASVGAALWFGRPLMYLAPIIMFAVANWLFIPYEEDKMRRQFGEEFDAYCRRVRRWI
jgi:protein-S-isoprenylcysteine O-methyltransferase Ste14